LGRFQTCSQLIRQHIRVGAGSEHPAYDTGGEVADTVWSGHGVSLAEVRWRGFPGVPLWSAGSVRYWNSPAWKGPERYALAGREGDGYPVGLPALRPSGIGTHGVIAS